MPIVGEYEPSPSQEVRDQVATYENAGAFPDYAEYQVKTDREILVFVLEPPRA